jgi:hypothetical protein
VVNAFQYSSTARSSIPLETSKDSVAYASREAVALKRRPHHLCDLRELVVGKESRIADHQARDRVGMVACPAQADRAAGVVHDEHDALESDLATEALERLDLSSPGSRRIGRRVTEAGQIRRDRAVPLGGERG